MSTTPYIGHCIHCDRLAELDTSTALCVDTKKCAKAAQNPKTKKEGSNGG